MMSDATLPSTGFAPLESVDARVLILGSLPSRKSLEQQQYYAHPRNGFWPIMGELFDAGPTHAYAERAARLLARHIAIWDVLRSSVRKGSLDASIEDESAEPNDFYRFYELHPAIHTIAFNGRKAEQMYRRLVFPILPARHNHRYLSLPSTSPAHAAMTFATKLQHWAAVKGAAMA